MVWTGPVSYFLIIVFEKISIRVLRIIEAEFKLSDS